MLLYISFSFSINLESINWMVVCVWMSLAFCGSGTKKKNGFGGQLSPDSAFMG